MPVCRLNGEVFCILAIMNLVVKQDEDGTITLFITAGIDKRGKPERPMTITIRQRWNWNAYTSLHLRTKELCLYFGMIGGRAVESMVFFTEATNGQSIRIMSATKLLQSKARDLLHALKFVTHLTVFCSLHPRLGENSPLTVLSPELLILVCTFL